MANQVTLAEGFHGKAIDAATTTGAVTGITLQVPLSRFTSQCLTTGTPTTISVKLQGSLDGTNWVDLTTHSAVGFQHFIAGPVKFIRGNVVTLTGGTSPTITLLVAATA